MAAKRLKRHKRAFDLGGTFEPFGSKEIYAPGKVFLRSDRLEHVTEVEGPFLRLWCLFAVNSS